MTIEAVRGMQAQKPFFVGIDSDGCVFDNMEIKHKECFCPAFIDNMELQAIARYARETWEFVNLYSRTRGFNRFPSLIRALKLLAERPEVKKRGITPIQLPELEKWLKTATQLSNPALEVESRRTGSAELSRVLAWSLDVNRAVDKIVRGLPVFTGTKAALQTLQQTADIVIVSQTPSTAILKEWTEHGIAQYVRVIAGQEIGSKADCITYASASRYAPAHVLMIGDSFGDYDAAQKSGALFYPIVPGQEDEAWERFLSEALPLFLAEKYAGAYEQSQLALFEKALPEHAPWEHQ